MFWYVCMYAGVRQHSLNDREFVTVITILVDKHVTGLTHDGSSKSFAALVQHDMCTMLINNR